ncbi:MAG: NADPH-dependent F420 reductase [Chloroflexota bacterium]|nr:NADPH-dependent F420 reductase [Chloroflexota bacterium]
MKIGIIGAGNVGQALATGSVGAGHTVTISSSTVEEAESAASQVGSGASVAPSNREAAADAEIVILAVPFDAVNGIIKELGPVLDGKILVDVTNRFAPDQLGAPSNAELIAEMTPNARVVKAFNTVFAANQADAAVEGVQLDGFVACDNQAAKEKMLEFVGSLGYRPIDAGPLAMARALEGMGTLNIYLNMTHQWPWQSGWKLLGPTG